MFDAKQIERFWSKVDRRGPDECWPWRASVAHGSGYGRFSAGGHVRAHRFSYAMHHGPIPDGMCVCHRCDNRACVNPAHLFLGTQAENCADMAAKGRAMGQPNRPCLADTGRRRVFLDDETHRRLAALRERMVADSLGCEVSHSHVLHLVIGRGLDALEAWHNPAT